MFNVSKMTFEHKPNWDWQVMYCDKHDLSTPVFLNLFWLVAPSLVF